MMSLIHACDGSGGVVTTDALWYWESWFRMLLDRYLIPTR